MDEEDSRQRKNGPIFEPPVYIQRYDFVESIVRQFGAKKVVKSYKKIKFFICTKMEKAIILIR